MADALLLVGRGATDVCERGVIVIENSGDGLVTRAARKFARAGDHAVELEAATEAMRSAPRGLTLPASRVLARSRRRRPSQHPVLRYGKGEA